MPGLGDVELSLIQEIGEYFRGGMFVKSVFQALGSDAGGLCQIIHQRCKHHGFGSVTGREKIPMISLFFSIVLT